MTKKPSPTRKKPTPDKPSPVKAVTTTKSRPNTELKKVTTTPSFVSAPRYGVWPD